MLDPSRMAAQVVSGIGFLGAGAILLRGETVRAHDDGGEPVGRSGAGPRHRRRGMYVGAISATIIIFIILAGIKPFEERYRASRQSANLQLQVIEGQLSLATLNEALGEGRTAKIKQFVVRHSEVTGIDAVNITLSPGVAQANGLYHRRFTEIAVRAGYSGNGTLTMRRLAIALLLALSACSTTHTPTASSNGPRVANTGDLPPPIQCVPFVRELSGVNLYGNAYTWWDSALAAGYQRGQTPMQSAVLVLKKSNRPRQWACGDGAASRGSGACRADPCQLGQR